MNIVVTNDDGIHTAGIWALAKAACPHGRTTVIAPDREQSGVGMGITYSHPVRVSEALSRVEGVKTLLVEGTPADTVCLAAQGLTPQPVGLVVSGINEGANTGIHMLGSGTVGAAFQAHVWGIPAIAFSAAERRRSQPEAPRYNFETAGAVAERLVGLVSRRLLEGSFLLNVNVPNLPFRELRGARLTRLARGKYTQGLVKVDTPKNDYYYLARGRTEWDAAEGTDVWAIRNGWVSITPLHIDLTSDLSLPHLGEVVNGLEVELSKA